MKKDVSFYRSLPYKRSIEIRDDETGRYFLARVAEIPFIRIDGETREEALLKLDEIFDDVILSMIEQGEDIPEPARWPDTLGGAVNYRPENIAADAPSAVILKEALPWTQVEESEAELTVV